MRSALCRSAHRFPSCLGQLPVAVLIGVIFLLGALAPAGVAAPARPFGSHPQPLASGTLQPRVDPAERDRVTAAAYDAWAARYLEPACRPGQWRVAAGKDAPAHVVSEGQGYGMVIVALMAGHDPRAQARFDGLARYALDHPSGVDGRLVAWAQGRRCRDVQGRDSATDGDFDIAYGLLLAHAQWGSGGAIDYLGAARRLLAGALEEDIHPRTDLPTLGDWTGPGARWSGTRPSDWMPGHFRAFAAATGDARWERVRRRVMRLAARVPRRSGLLPDFVVRGRPARAGYLEGADDGHYSWNACRTPWRIGTDAAYGGDPGAHRAAARASRWIRAKTRGRPARVRAGYSLRGRALVDYGSMAFTAPFAVAAMSDPGGQAWLDALWAAMASGRSEGYYADSIRLQSMLVVSGNWWAP
jgi:endoglucanase